MKRFLPKLLWTLAFILGLYFVASSFVKTKDSKEKEESCTEKCSASKAQTGVSFKNLSRHLLDFNK